jgi:endonuclease/exonuclease/phosphatase family metal-dependent hydrolase/ribosomal protein S28E/S33
VRSLSRTGALKSLLEQVDKYNIDVAALQETKWLGSEITDMKSYTIFKSGKPSGNREFGVAFIVNKKFKQLVTDFKPINERLCALRIKTTFFNVWLINIHAPTEDKDDDIKDEFYSLLEYTYDSLPSNDMKIVLGDFNAKVGKEETYKGTIGGHSLHDTSNDNGQRVVDFASSRNIVVSSTFFPHRNIHKRTWASPDGVTFNQIDHVLTDKRAASSILDVRSYRGANCDSDHYLVKATFRCRIATRGQTKSQTAPKFDIEKLKERSIAVAYESALESHLNKNLNLQEMQVEELWSRIKNDIKSVAEEVIGLKSRRKRNDWRDDECKDATRKKNEAYIQYTERTTRAKKEAYKELRRFANKTNRRKKRKYLNDELREMDENFKQNNTRAAYAVVKQLKAGFQPTTSLCKDTNGNIISDAEEIKSRWKQYFQELLNPSGPTERHTSNNLTDRTADEEPTSSPPTLEEVKSALGNQKNNKAPGVDNIPAELLKWGGECVAKIIHALISSIWTKEILPNDWRKSIICPVYKKGDKLRCENYRGISLLCTSYKVFSKILESRIKPLADKITGEYQGGFRTGRSTTDQIFSVKQVLEKCWEYNIEVHQIFVDFKQAYDSIDRTVLYTILLDLGIPAKLVRLIKLTMTGSISQVRVQNDLTASFETECGLKQGDGLAPILFNLALEYVIRRIPVDTKGTLLFKSTQVVAYADDINIMARSLVGAKEVLVNLDSSAREVGLRINENKTKVMTQTRRNTPIRQNLTVADYNFENVENFVYLGTNISKDGNETEEIKRRILLANKTYYWILPIIRNKDVHRNAKLRIYKSIIRPVLCYGSETWTLTQASEKMINACERKILRRILGPVRIEDVWRTRYNVELYTIFDDPEVSTLIKLRKLQWAGHVVRMDDERIPKRALKGKAEGKRPVGKPRKRWQDSIDADSKSLLRFSNWRTRSLDRDAWRRSIQEAKARLGLSRH